MLKTLKQDLASRNPESRPLPSLEIAMFGCNGNSYVRRYKSWRTISPDTVTSTSPQGGQNFSITGSTLGGKLDNT